MKFLHFLQRLLASGAVIVGLTGVATPLALAQRASTVATTDAPEASSGRQDKAVVSAHRHLIVAAHPLAAQAGRDVLRQGGTAIDAAIAAVFVLNVVEPQSSGIGGGGFLLHYDRASRRMTAWDGRETAPAAARAERFMTVTAQGERPMRFVDAIGSGLSVGVPGLVAMLEAAHRESGKLPWARLLEPAIRAASDGFPISPRLASLIAGDPLLAKNPAARTFFYHAEGRPKQIGERLFNPRLAIVLRRIASEGSPAFYRGEIARDMVEAVHSAFSPGDLAEADLAGYQVVRREALCARYRTWRICGMPPPSSGALAVAQMLAMLERFEMARHPADTADAVHLIAEAGRLAYADRDRYIADPAFVAQPVTQLLDRAYLASRSALIDPQRSMGIAKPGEIAEAPRAGADRTQDQPATTHLSVVDDKGNAVSLTASVESAFGSRIMVRGFLLNNQLTDFSFLPSTDGVPAANRVQAGKRPRSSMAPTLVFDDREQLRWVLGSPGGPMIINYVAKALIGLMDWNLDPQAAAALPNIGNRNGVTELESGTPAAGLADALRQRGHETRNNDQTSGLNILAVQPPRRNAPAQLLGGADPRREGVALGD
jgi:gamma-glutamyltranspeptidase/glutathione hydrolase